MKHASGKQSVKLSKVDWQSIGKQAGWLKQAQESPSEYYLNKGKIYDAEGDDITDSMDVLKAMMKIDYAKEGIDYNGKGMPRFRTSEEANKFLAAIERVSGNPLGRVGEDDMMKKLRYKDTRQERQEENEKDRTERNLRLQDDLSFVDPEKSAKHKEKVKAIEERERMQENADALSQEILDEQGPSDASMFGSEKRREKRMPKL